MRALKKHMRSELVHITPALYYFRIICSNRVDWSNTTSKKRNVTCFGCLKKIKGGKSG